MMVKREILLFWLVCIPLRVLDIVISALFFKELRIPLMVVHAIQSLFFAASAALKRKSGVFAEERWWFSSVHSFFYLAFVILAAAQQKQAYLALVVDVVFGVSHWVVRAASLKKN